MSIRIGLVLIAIHVLFVSIESQIGSYPALNPTHCGLSRHSMENSSDCFKYHKNKVSDEIRNGRNATAGEAPWLVYIDISYSASNGSNTVDRLLSCSGSLIGQQWVLTAAHCFDIKRQTPGFNLTKGPDLIVFLGYRFVYRQWWDQKQNLDNKKISHQEYDQWLANKQIIIANVTDWWTHPNYTNKFIRNFTGDSNNYYVVVHDIALIKLSEPIASGPLHNSICIPDEHHIEADNSLVFVAGYGLSDSIANFGYSPAQITYGKVAHTGYSMIMTLKMLDEAGSTCQGDSGGPAWQYRNGRAVLLGVHNGGYFGTAGCTNRWPIYKARVSAYIDWIIHLTGLDVWHLK